MIKYKALQPIGRFKIGDFVADLTDAQIKTFISKKIIEAVDAQPTATKKRAKINV